MEFSIKELWNNWTSKKADDEKKRREYESLHRFNIIEYNGTPVITLDGVIITDPNDQPKNKDLVAQMLILRKIYVSM